MFWNLIFVRVIMFSKEMNEKEIKLQCVDYLNEIASDLHNIIIELRDIDEHKSDLLVDAHRKIMIVQVLLGNELFKTQ